MTLAGNVISNTPLTRGIRLSGNQFRRGVTAPSEETVGTTPTVPVLRFAATNELVSLYVALKPNTDLTQPITLRLHWLLNAVETNNDQLDVTCDYTRTVASSTGNGPGRASTQVTGQVTVTTGAGLAIGDEYLMDIVFAVADATNPLANAVGLAIEIHLTNTTGVASADLVGGELVYQALQ